MGPSEYIIYTLIAKFGLKEFLTLSASLVVHLNNFTVSDMNIKRFHRRLMDILFCSSCFTASSSDRLMLGS